MSVFEELLIMVGAPVLITVAIYAAVYLRDPRPQSRYRAGEPYNFKPVWFVARDGVVDSDVRPGALAQVEAGAEMSDDKGEEIASGPKGGSHGQW